MTSSVLNRQRRRQRRAIRRAERRRMRRTEGNWKFYPSRSSRPNLQRDTWHQGKEMR